jgi:transposase
LCRRLKKAGYDCMVVAPSLIPTQPRKQKTDDLDAQRIARFLRSADLEPIWVPDAATEAMRDLSRAREDAVEALQQRRQQLRTFLVRHDRQWKGTSTWTQPHEAWIRQQQFDHEAQRRTLAEYLCAVQEAGERVKRLEQDIAVLVQTWSMAPLVTALQALRGVKLITAFTLVAELGTFKRFGTAKQLMSYLGLVPSERSSGERTRKGAITKAGNAHVRRVLCEAAWNNRFRHGASEGLKRRRALVSGTVKSIAEKAQMRLSTRMRNLSLRGKENNKIAIALARELAGFIWHIGQQQDLLAS